MDSCVKEEIVKTAVPRFSQLWLGFLLVGGGFFVSPWATYWISLVPYLENTIIVVNLSKRLEVLVNIFYRTLSIFFLPWKLIETLLLLMNLQFPMALHSCCGIFFLEGVFLWWQRKELALDLHTKKNYCGGGRWMEFYTSRSEQKWVWLLNTQAIHPS